VCVFCGVASASAKGNAFFHWVDYVKQQAERTPLFINLDETSVPLSFPTVKGMVVQRRWWKSPKAPGQNILRNMRRSAVTHVGLITHRTDIQAVSPQIFIGNEAIFTLGFLAATSHSRPTTVKFWRQKSSWNTSALMFRILEELASSLAAYPDVQPILSLDVATIHLTKVVADQAKALGIWLFFVPAKCTWLLQPLDTHVFSPYKAFLRRKYRDCKGEDGSVDKVKWASLLYSVATEFLCGRRWLRSFEATGVLGARACLSKDIQALELAILSAGPGVQIPFLNNAELQAIFPRRKKVPCWSYFQGPARRRRRLLIL
jgi:hypothetical protein